MISFGDLLTLLVCFFLVLTPSLSSSASSTQGDQRVNSAKEGQSLGTGLASGSSRDERVVNQVDAVRLPETRFLLRRGAEVELPGQLRDVWEGFSRSPAKPSAVKVTVSLCDVEAYEEVVASVRRQLPSGKRAQAPEIVRRQFEIGAECSGDQEARDALAKGELLAIVRFEEALNG
jgi:hypothetical protein